MTLYDAKRQPVTLGESVGRGGEATVYRVMPTGGSLAKIYEPQPRPNYPAKLAWMVAHPPDNPTQSHNHSSLAWPDGLLYDDKRQLAGYTMPYIGQAVPLLEVFNPRRRAEILPQFDRRYLHRTARNLAAAFSALHRSGYVAGDINESNVLVTPTALVTLIDTDSFQVREERKGASVIYPCPVGKPEYTPPELQGKALNEITRNADQDAFGLAVLIFQLLMEGSHPFRAQWLGEGDPPPLEARIAQGAYPYNALPSHQVAPPNNAPGLDTLHPWLAELFRRCFVDGHRSPRWRPGPDLWVRAIKQAEDALVCCAEGHYYTGHLYRCPYCARAQTRMRGQGFPSRSENPSNREQQSAQPIQSPNPPQPNPASRSRMPFGSPLTGFARAAGGSSGAASAVWGNWWTSRPTGVLRQKRRMQPSTIGIWLRQRVRKSITVGAVQGAAAGALPAAVMAGFNWSNSAPLNWALLLILSGAAAGMLRGYKPGYQLGVLVNRYIGWKRFWQGVCAITGSIAGMMVGFLFGWAVIPVILGFILGARTGLYLGEKIWLLGNHLSWERIWGVLSALGAAAVGWGIASLVGAVGLNTLGADLTAALLPYTGSQTASWAVLWLAAGGISGALVGSLSGFTVDLMGRFTNLIH